jgi:hypothetical protein
MPKVTKKAPAPTTINRPACLVRFAELLEQERNQGFALPPGEQGIDPNAFSDADLVAAGKRLAGRVRGDATVLGDLVVTLVERGKFELAYRQAQRIADERERNGVIEFVRWFVVGEIEAAQGLDLTSVTVFHSLSWSDILARLAQGQKQAVPHPAQERNGPAPRVVGEELFTDTPSLFDGWSQEPVEPVVASCALTDQPAKTQDCCQSENRLPDQANTMVPTHLPDGWKWVLVGEGTPNRWQARSPDGKETAACTLEEGGRMAVVREAWAWEEQAAA